MSRQNNDATSTIHKWSARVDLTSRDLQTGMVQLPGRLQDLPLPGALEAFDPETEADYLLDLRDPRALHGLSEFFTAQGLKPNDTLTLSLQGNRLTLQAIKRQRRGQQGRANEPAPTAPSEPLPPDSMLEGAIQIAEAEPEPPAAPPVEAKVVEPKAVELNAVETIPAEVGIVDAIPPEPAPEAGLSEPEPEAAARPRVLEAEPEPEPKPESDIPAADPFSDFARADGFDPFDELDELEGLDIHGPAGEAAPLAATAAAEPAYEPVEEFTALETQPEEETLRAGPKVELSASQEADATAAEETAVSSPRVPALTSLHTLPRRPFRSQVAAGPTRPAQPFRVAANSPGTPAPVPEPEFMREDPEPGEAAEVPELTAAEQRGVATDRLEAYLAAPTIPAIIQVTKLAAELQLDVAELADAVRAKAAEPDSRLSNIRPDYYLYRRPTD